MGISLFLSILLLLIALFVLFVFVLCGANASPRRRSFARRARSRQENFVAASTHFSVRFTSEPRPRGDSGLRLVPMTSTDMDYDELEYCGRFLPDADAFVLGIKSILLYGNNSTRFHQS